jgi:hypothetical protein
MNAFTNQDTARAMEFRELLRLTAKHGAQCPCAMCAEIRRR